MTPMKAIRAKCLDCCCGSSNEVRLCPSEDCPLWPYRFGHNPNRKGTGGKISTLTEKVASHVGISDANAPSEGSYIPPA